MRGTLVAIDDQTSIDGNKVAKIHTASESYDILLVEGWDCCWGSIPDDVTLGDVVQVYGEAKEKRDNIISICSNKHYYFKKVGKLLETLSPHNMRMKLTKEPVTSFAGAKAAPEPLRSLSWC